MKPLHIILAEDNEADVILVRQALETHGISHQLYVLRDGYDAIQFVSRIGTSADAPLPDILLLDLNLPKVDGVDVLREFRNHPQCADTPVIIMSSSGMERNHSRMEGLRISRYFQKPFDLDEFMNLGAIVREVTR